ncbi:MAG: hypothetical protein EPN97_14675 [Alphaproteobacteria bacterium]|nr:MAG: hypothetical protein EPN97_14675 [Alphaproteobacteria bacterium]
MGNRKLSDAGIRLKRIFMDAADDSSLYTQGEVDKVKMFLEMQGYVFQPDGAYPDEQKFRGVVFDYKKTDAAGNVLGIVSLHLDKGNKTGMVQDGLVTVAHDEVLQEKVGATTTIAGFAAAMIPGPVQKIIKRFSHS